VIADAILDYKYQFVKDLKDVHHVEASKCARDLAESLR